MSQKTKEFKSPTEMLMWQWRSILEELNELQRHLSDPDCPCVLADTGEYCGPKHALGLHTLAKETAAMSPEHSEMLETLAEEALDQHNALKDRIVCGKPHKDEKDTVLWSRNWRKRIEDIYYHICGSGKKAKLHDVVELQDTFQKEITIFHPITGKSKSVMALVDTGSTLSVVSTELAEELNLPRVKGHWLEQLHDARGMTSYNVYSANTRIGERMSPDLVWAVPEKGYYYIGARTLEILGYTVDPLNRNIYPVEFIGHPPVSNGEHHARLHDVVKDIAELAQPAPFGWVGGKKLLSKRIVAMIPPHKTYVEPFCGAASVFWAKPPSEIEVLNDADPDLIRFYKNISEVGRCNIKHTAENFDSLLKKTGKLSPCEFLSQVVCSFGNKRKYYVGRGKEGTAGDTACSNGAPQFYHYLPEYQERLKKTHLYCGDWQKVVEKYDASDTFFFLDPPYHGTSRDYSKGDDVLSRLAQVLPKLKGKWLMTYDDHPDVRKSLDSFNITAISADYTINHNSHQEGKQLIITNYKPKAELGESKPFSESRLCYGVKEATKKLKWIDKSLGMSKSAVAKIQKDLSTPGSICAGQAEMMQSVKNPDKLKPLIKDELKAVSEYNQLAKKFNQDGDSQTGTLLGKIADDELGHYSELAKRYVELGGKSSESVLLSDVTRKDPYGSRCRDPKTGYWIESKDCGFEPEGAKTEAISGNGKDRYMFEHVITDVDKLIVSNNPFTFEVNPLYPKELQPRLRDRKASRIQVEKIAAGLIPDALITDFHSLDRGSPIIGPDMVVEAGNGRVMALQLAVKNFPQSYKAYKDRLKERITDFGISIKDMEKIEHPVLVRLRLTDVDRVAFSKSTNTSAVMVPSSIEVAKIDAEDITLEMIKNLTVLENESIEDALKSSRNQAFAMRFMKNLPENEQANIVDAKGILNRDGVQRMVMAIFVSAFPGETGLKLAEKAFETIDQDVKNTVNALARALGPLAEAEALIRQGQRDATLSVANDIAQAITIYSKIRQLPELTVDKYFSQSQMFGKELSPFQEKVLLTIDKYRRSPNRLGAIFSGYARSVIAQPPPQQTSMIAMAPVSKEQLWDNAERRTSEELETERKTKEEREQRRTAPAMATMSEGQAVMFAPSIPKLIEIHPNVIIKHYAEVKAMHKNSIRTTKPDSPILVILGCPKKSTWTKNKCKPYPVVVATHVPNTAKYRNDLEKLLGNYPALKSKVKHYTTEGVEAQVSDNVEKGFAVCETKKGELIPGPQAVGDKSSVSVTMNCPAGSKTKAIYHVHPSGNLEPSEKDLQASKKFGVPVCAGTIDGKKVECHAA